MAIEVLDTDEFAREWQCSRPDTLEEAVKLKERFTHKLPLASASPTGFVGDSTKNSPSPPVDTSDAETESLLQIVDSLTRRILEFLNS